MQVLGHGIDVVDVPRLNRLLRKDDDFLLGWFTNRELEDLASRTVRADVVAGRVAAKEAVAKALGTGFDDEVSWQDIEILADDSGAPLATISGGALDVANRGRITKLLLSISHSANTAVASAIALG